MSYAYDNEEFSRYYDAFVTEHVSSDVYFTDTIGQICNEIIQRTFVANQSAIIVELGCGTGENLISWKDHFSNDDIKLIGIDHSQAMLTRAKEKLNNTIELIHGNLTNFADYLPRKSIDCILLPADTFHHLITDTERQQFLINLRQTLRPDTGLFLLYLFPDSLIHIDAPPTEDNEDKFKLISTENIEQSNQEWLSKQTFQFNIPPKIELSWQLRTCSIPKLLQLFYSYDFEMIFCCLNGKDLLPSDEHLLLSLNQISTPVILVFRTIKNTN